MSTALVECVPNFSEGRDRIIFAALQDAVRSVSGAFLLDATMDADHHRSVLTFAGPAASVANAAIAVAEAAVGRIDLRRHAGVHPRIGALDVLPFVPLAGSTMEQCASLAVETASRIWERCHVPAYLYEAAARREPFRNLSELRRIASGQPPDIGGPEWHPTAGAIAAGARRFLIAFNVNLDSDDILAARRIAQAVRGASGGLPAVKALGLPLASRGLVQVSMNLTDFEITPVHAAYEAVCREAERMGVRVKEAEFIGLLPRRAFALSAGRVPGLDASLILEDRLAVALYS